MRHKVLVPHTIGLGGLLSVKRFYLKPCRHYFTRTSDGRAEMASATSLVQCIPKYFYQVRERLDPARAAAILLRLLLMSSFVISVDDEGVRLEGSNFRLPRRRLVHAPLH